MNKNTVSVSIVIKIGLHSKLKKKMHSSVEF